MRVSRGFLSQARFLISGFIKAVLVHPRSFLVVNVDNMTAGTDNTVGRTACTGLGGLLCGTGRYLGGIYTILQYPGGI